MACSFCPSMTIRSARRERVARAGQLLLQGQCPVTAVDGGVVDHLLDQALFARHAVEQGFLDDREQLEHLVERKVHAGGRHGSAPDDHDGRNVKEQAELAAVGHHRHVHASQSHHQSNNCRNVHFSTLLP